MFRPGEPFINGHPKKAGVIDPFHGLPEEPYCLGFRDAPTVLDEGHGRALRDIYGDPPFPQPPLQVTAVSLQVFDGQRWLTGRGYNGRVVCIESHLNVAGRRRHIVYIQAEKVG